MKKASELNPNYASAHQWYSYSVLRYKRLMNEEMREAARALELDPLAPVMSLNMGQSLYLQERYDEAIGYFDRALTIDPDFFLAQLSKALCYLNSKRYDEAIRLAET